MTQTSFTDKFDMHTQLVNGLPWTNHSAQNIQPTFPLSSAMIKNDVQVCSSIALFYMYMLLGFCFNPCVFLQFITSTVLSAVNGIMEMLYVHGSTHIRM